MKKLCLIIALLFGTLCGGSLRAQTPEVLQLILNIEKLNELRKILRELKKGYEILFQGYTTIKNLSEGNFKLHELFLNGLLQVSPAVKNYQRIPEIISCQLALVKEFKNAYQHFSSSGRFSSQELAYIEKVYGQLLRESLDNLDALTQVLTAKKLRASDDERLTMIDSIYENMTVKLTFLRHFNSNTALLGRQRRREEDDTESLQQILDITP